MKILLSGHPGIGKSTILNKALSLLQEQNLHVEGCIVHEIINEGKRSGFKIHYIPGPHETLLASTDQILSHHSLSKYSINIDGIENELIPYMKKMALSDQADVLFFDEIGRMQSASPHFLPHVTALIGSNTPLVATIVQDDEEWARPYKNNPNVFYMEVTQENRDVIADLIHAMLRSVQNFNQLTSAHKDGVHLFFNAFINEYKFLELMKLFKHTVPYLAQNRVVYDHSMQRYRVHGNSAVRHVTFDKTNGCTCTCLFHQGDGGKMNRRLCSHIQTVAILKDEDLILDTNEEMSETE